MCKSDVDINVWDGGHQSKQYEEKKKKTIDSNMLFLFQYIYSYTYLQIVKQLWYL